MKAGVLPAFFFTFENEIIQAHITSPYPVYAV